MTFTWMTEKDVPMAVEPLQTPEIALASSPGTEASPLVRAHLRQGWLSLLIFLTLGIALEALHGLKIGFYLDVESGTRRLLWTLAHAHGTLLSLVHLGFAATVRLLPEWGPAPRLAASRCLLGATVLVPAGFFLGGLFVHAGDPGLGILLVPVGAALLFAAVWLAWRAAR